MDDSELSTMLSAILSMPRDHPDFVHNLDVFGGLLQARYRQTEALEDVNRSIGFENYALEKWPVQRASFHHRLSVAYISRFPISRSPDDLDEAVKAAEESAEASQIDQGLKSRYLNTLGTALQLRFSNSGDVADLERAISIVKQAIILTSDGDQSIAVMYNNLCCFQLDLYQAKKESYCLKEAIESGRSAMRHTADNHPEKPRRLNNLAAVYQASFEQDGDIDDLESSIKMLREALKIISPNSSLRHGPLLNIATGLIDRYEVNGSLADLNEAIDKTKEALARLPNEHIDRPSGLSNYSVALTRRFDRENSSDDLDEAADSAREALILTPTDHPKYVLRSGNLVRTLQAMALDIGSTDLLDEAIAIAEHAIQNCAQTRPIYSELLQLLGICLDSRFAISKDPSTDLHFLNAAVANCRDALKYASNSKFKVSMLHHNLGNVLTRRYKQTGAKDDLDSAINELSLSAKMCPIDSPTRAMLLKNKGDALRERYYLTKLPGHLSEASKTYAEGSRVEFAPATWRILCARRAAALLHKDSPAEAAELMEHAVYLLRKVCPRTLGRYDHQYLLSQFGGLASDAVALFFLAAPAGNPEKALTLLELGRGVMSNLLLEERGDMGLLKSLAPHLAQQLQDILEKLDSVSLDLMNPRTEKYNELHANSNQTRRKISNEFDKVVDAIRALPEFRDFLGGPSIDEIKSCTSDNSAVIVLNVSQYGSDAIIITSGGITHLALPDLKYQRSEEITKTLIQGLYRSGVVRDAIPLSSQPERLGLDDSLKWLWENGIELVLTRLGFTKTPEGRWPRVWWIPVGPLSLLPIHAAGPDSDLCVLDRVISSYAPTIQVLCRARSQREKLLSQRIEKIGFLCMPTTPRQKNLPFAAVEVDHIKKQIPSSMKFEIPEDPKQEDATRLFKECNLMHFACHGETSADPSKSLILLSDWEEHPFMVYDMIQMNLKNTHFAYLSACQTGSSKTETLLDEAIHMAGTCLIAGIPSVIGTLWEIEDEESAKIAERVYMTMKADANGFDVSRAAESLHFAIREARKPGILMEKRPYIWASYIHFGV